jgi:hypothetical protein
VPGRVFVGLWNRNTENVRDKVVGISLRRRDQFKPDVGWEVLESLFRELRLFPRCRASTREVGAPTCDTGARIRSYAACVQNAGSASIAMDLLEPRMTLPSVANRRAWWVIALSTPQALAPPIKCSEEWEGGPWRGPVRHGRIGAAWLPGHEFSAIRAPLGRHSKAFPYPDSSPVATHNGPPGRRRCGNSHPPSNQRTAVRWPRLLSR